MLSLLSGDDGFVEVMVKSIIIQGIISIAIVIRATRENHGGGRFDWWLWNGLPEEEAFGSGVWWRAQSI